MHYKTIAPYKRLSKRSVDEAALASKTRQTALESDGWAAQVGAGDWIKFNYGGSWPDALNQKTEVALAVSDPNGLTVVFVNYAQACGHKSDRFIANTCLPGCQDIWDKRIKNKDRRATAWINLRSAHAEHFSSLERLAMAAD